MTQETLRNARCALCFCLPLEIAIKLLQIFAIIFYVGDLMFALQFVIKFGRNDPFTVTMTLVVALGITVGFYVWLTTLINWE